MGVGCVWAGTTHRGRVRQTNEDAILAGPQVFAVADGVGGASGGRDASSITIGQLMNADAAGPLDETSIRAAIDQANATIRSRAGDRVMGTTLAGIALANSTEALMFNIGDSRVYRIRDNELEQLSRDHSIVSDLIVAGTITADEATTHPDRGVITRAIGAVADPQVDIQPLETLISDRFLICSDGLTDELGDAEIMAIATSHPTASSMAQELLDRALDSGGHDNVSIVIVDVVPGIKSASPDTTTRRRPQALTASAR